METSHQGAPQRLGDYEILQWLATGGMAEVYLARRRGARGFTKQVALKRILPKFASHREFVTMFINEAQLCSGLTHPNLVEVFDFGEEDGELFMAMELVDGTNCAKLVRAAAARGETVPIEDALFITLNVLRALEFAHDAENEKGEPLKLVHRDVSPGNVLISRTGAIKLADFGIARATPLEHCTENGQLKGKLGYMSPEQVMGQDLDRRSDLFTLGIILAELLSGRPLFAYGTETDILVRIRDADISTFLRYSKGIPTELREIVRKALARSPEARYQHAGSFAEAIESFVRQHRLALGPVRLAAYLEALGLVKPASRSGEFRFRGILDSTPRAKPMRCPEPPVMNESAPVTYRVRLDDGSLQGPFPLARILERLITGRIPPNAQVSRNDGPFLALCEHPELRRIASRSSSQWDFTVNAAEGQVIRFDERTLPYHLYEIALKAPTATLLAIHGLDRKKIHIKEGSVSLVSSTDPSELLGERLLRANRILPIELDMALALAPRHGGRVGDALVGLGILRPLELFQALYEQTFERTAALLSWTEGELWLLPPENYEEDGLPWGISLLEMITRGILQTYKETTLHRFLDGITTLPLHPGPRSAPCPTALRLPPGPTTALLAVDGVRSLTDLLRSPPSPKPTELEILQGIYIGLASGALRVEGC
ncbi:MAG: protein kinase [Myxococcales bacterium]|nr:protein kinase [Polyangiaceae bacterium]MDW8250378.1 protein kinase [Myxococcales bacterium]